MQKLADEMLVDIDKETIDFRDNYDGSRQEPVVLPAKCPSTLERSDRYRCRYGDEYPIA